MKISHVIECGAVITVGLILAGIPNTAPAADSTNGPAGQNGAATSDAFDWPSKPPADCPFQPSSTFVGIHFTGRHREYTDADTWYPSWASDGNLYSPFTDGSVPSKNGQAVACNSGGRPAATGAARIEGDDPFNLAIEPIGVWKSSPLPYAGRYPCGTLVHNGIWYYGTYLVDIWKREIDGVTYPWASLEPLVGFRISRDLGKTWEETPHTPCNPLFPEIAGKTNELETLNKQPRGLGSQEVRSQISGLPLIKMGSPHFIDFGRNMEHSPDGKAYLVAHGSLEPDPKPRFGNNSWCAGDQVFMARVTPTPENINDAGKYEFFAGYDGNGVATWSHDFGRIKPVLDWNNRCGCATVTYNAPLRKYLMCVTDGWPTSREMNTYILESDNVAGPWKLVVFMENFGTQAYFVNIPSKFISRDGLTFFLCYSGNYTNAWLKTKYPANPPGSRYALCLQEVRLRTK